MLEFLNSPKFLLIITVCLTLFGLVIFFKNRFIKALICKACKKGKMEEAEKEPLGIFYNRSNPGWGEEVGSRSARVKMKVKYKCTHCGECYSTVESR